jgi:hypothetical protein
MIECSVSIAANGSGCKESGGMKVQIFNVISEQAE